jgi:hypothetical protein
MSSFPAFDLVIFRGSLPPDLEARVAEVFGTLRSAAKQDLVCKVAEALRTYYFNRLGSALPTESSQAARLRRIRDVAKTLMALLHAERDGDDRSPEPDDFRVDLDRDLGVPLSEVLLAAAQHDDELYQVLASDIVAPGGVISSAMVRGNELVLTHHAALRIATMGIAALAAAADRAHESAAEAVLPGRGGRRRTQVKPTTTLIIELIAVYAELRARHPNSGPPLAYSANSHLDRFVKTILGYAQNHWDELRHVSDGAIRAAYHKYRRAR